MGNIVKPHLTLVFPFRSDITTSELEAHIKGCIYGIEPFTLALHGITASVEPFANYLFLNVTSGMQEILTLSQSLYTGILSKHKSKPHMIHPNKSRHIAFINLKI